ncbi:MAG TPA: lysophospholipid acyltransferase family protein [Abditibacteriaceae bacterium]|jgi:KDO2-lipid IV(A) lauroyltransferase
MNEATTNSTTPKFSRDAVEVKIMRLFGGTMERASWAGCRRSGVWLGLLFYHAIKGRREVATNNVRLAFPHMSQAAAQRMARRSAQNFAMMFCEFMHLRTASPTEVRAYADIDGLEHIEQGLQQGRGVLLLTAHLGNWEVMGARAAQEFPLTVIARPTSNAGVENHIAQVRAAACIGVISKFDTGRAALNVLRKNGTLGILPDQHAGPEGVLLPMFGHPTRFVTAIPRLAMLSGAPIVPAFGVRRTPWLSDGRIVARVSPGIMLEKGKALKASTRSREEAIVEGTRCVINEIEKIVRQHPDQWLWMHRRWRRSDERDAAVQSQNGDTSGINSEQ